ncbi:Uncharacterised protein [Mycobacteroides abscessus subsp. abscessus]|nr:Uncharacterised protein [Mycobacteroides abscessus subsp. abscessus]
MDQRTNPGDQQCETHRQLIEGQPEIDVQSAYRGPAEKHLVHHSIGPGPAEHAEECPHGHQERPEGRRTAHQMPPGISPAADEQEHSRASKRQRRHEPCHEYSPPRISTHRRRRPRPTCGCGRSS